LTACRNFPKSPKATPQPKEKTTLPLRLCAFALKNHKPDALTAVNRGQSPGQLQGVIVNNQVSGSQHSLFINETSQNKSVIA
jgi:hypothetical protein